MPSFDTGGFLVGLLLNKWVSFFAQLGKHGSTPWPQYIICVDFFRHGVQSIANAIFFLKQFNGLNAGKNWLSMSYVWNKLCIAGMVKCSWRQSICVLGAMRFGC